MLRIILRAMLMLGVPLAVFAWCCYPRTVIGNRPPACIPGTYQDENLRCLASYTIVNASPATFRSAGNHLNAALLNTLPVSSLAQLQRFQRSAFVLEHPANGVTYLEYNVFQISAGWSQYHISYLLRYTPTEGWTTLLATPPRNQHATGICPPRKRFSMLGFIYEDDDWQLYVHEVDDRRNVCATGSSRLVRINSNNEMDYLYCRVGRVCDSPTGNGQLHINLQTWRREVYQEEIE